MHNIADYQAQIKKLQEQYQALQDTEVQQDIQEVRSYADRLAGMQKLYQNLPASKPRPDTIPAIFNRSYDENFISDYLAYILDPARNGLGSEPLEALVALVWPELEETGFQEVEVYREYNLDGGRIDLLILVDDALVVGIENKIFSGEGTNQTSSYARVIRREFPEHIHALVFLSSGGIKPGSKYFRALSYRQLLHSFKALGYDWTEDIKKSILWEDFLEHLEEFIVNEKSDFEFSPKARLYLENYEMIEDLQEAYKIEWKPFIKHLEARLLAQLGPNEWEIDSSQWQHNWNRVFKKSWKGDNVFINFSYYFSPDQYEKNKFHLRLNAEGKYYKDFINIYRSHMSSIQPIYDKLGLVIQPTDRDPWTRDHVLMYWVVNYDPNEVTPADMWIQAMDKINSIIRVVDESLVELESTIKDTE